jgi:hypothetical protein
MPVSATQPIRTLLMSARDIYDDMPDTAAEGRLDPQRSDELERDGAARRARIAQVIALEELWHEVVQAHSAFRQ